MFSKKLWLGALCGALLAGCASQPAPASLKGERHIQATVAAPAAAAGFGTPTPFRPLNQTPQTGFPVVQQSAPTIPAPMGPAAEQIIPQPASAAALEPTLNFYGIDFDSRQRVTIEITPPDKKVNRGKPIKFSFIPAERCRFEQKTACAYAYKPSYAGNVIVLTVHSGLGGEGQRLRSALEGTGINRAGVKLERVHSNMEALAGAQVRITQGDTQVEVQLDALTRIPAVSLKRYFKVNLSDILRVAADLDPRISDLVRPDGPQLVIETCGWKMPGEPGSAGVADTTGSVYLGIIN